jgi:uncharacterized protein YbbC (DUF1343 family)
MNAACAVGADLTVIQLHGWQRSLWFDETGLPWVPTSPAMPHLSTATLYPGMCLFEGTNLSVGRGTALPFEIYGAPWIDGYELATRLNGLVLPGVRFRALNFIPSTSRCAGQSCGGVQVHMTDRAALRPVALGLHMIATVHSLYPREFAWEAAHFDRLTGSPSIRQALESGTAVERLTDGWQHIQTTFQQQRQAYLRY